LTKWVKTTLENDLVAFTLMHKGEPLCENAVFYFDPVSQRYHYGMSFAELASRTEQGAKKEVFDMAHRTVLRKYLNFAAAAVDLET
jgi:hypothetical protein